MVRLKLVTVVLTSLLLLIFAYFLYESVGYSISDSKALKNVENFTPQVIEIFKENKENFDVLINGQFIVESRNISSYWQGTQKALWAAGMSELENLPKEEKDAILYLLTDEYLGSIFQWISSSDGDLRVNLYTKGNAYMIIDHTSMSSHTIPPHPFVINESYVNLGDGYVLWTFNEQRGTLWYVLRNFLIILMILLIIAIAYSLKPKKDTKKREPEAKNDV